MEKGATNGMAIASLGLGIASVFLSPMGLPPILAIIFGGLGLDSASKTSGNGKVLSIIGLVLGTIYTLVYIAKITS